MTGLLLDVRTIVALCALISALLAGLLVYVVRGFPERLRAPLWHWVVGETAQSLGWFLFALRGQIGDVWSIVLANVLLAVGYAEWVRSLRRFARPGERYWDLYAAVAWIAACAALFTFMRNDLQARVTLITLGLLFITSMGWRAVWALQPAPRPSADQLMLIVYGTSLTVLLIRFAGQFTGGVPIEDPLALTMVQAVVFSTGAFAPVLGTFGVVLMAADRLNRDLGRLAGLDPLTEVPNRRSLEAMARRAIAEARRHGRSVAVLLADADHFKKINDSFGHAVGDEALKALAQRMRTTLRSEDVLGRLGGEEFVIVVPDADEEAATQGAERIRASIETAEFRTGGTRVPLRLSIGVAALAGEDDDFAALLKRADMALYEAKRRGRNRVVRASELAGAG